jgi:hypothetical protein
MAREQERGRGVLVKGAGQVKAHRKWILSFL